MAASFHGIKVSRDLTRSSYHSNAMLIRKDETVVERPARPSARSADIGDPFAIKFVGSDFEIVFPYHRLIRAAIRDDVLAFIFDDGVSIECEGSNLRAILDSTWTARLQVVEETPETKNRNRLLAEGEIVVASLRYCDREQELNL
jgi:hypothetical protein